MNLTDLRGDSTGAARVGHTPGGEGRMVTGSHQSGLYR